MAKVLILGAKGMLGQALVRVFSSPLPRQGGGQPPLNIRGGEGELFAWDREDCDITDHTSVLKKIQLFNFSRSAKIKQFDASPLVVINAAAYNDVDGAEKDATLANKINGEAVGYLASAAASVGATFVHYSTDYVFDGTKKEGYREDDIPNPISAYGRSKLLGEQKIQNSEFRIQNCYLIRTSRLFGEQGNGKQSFVDLMLERAKKIEVRLPGGSPTSQIIEAVDEEFSSPTYVEDLAARTREIIEQKKPSGVYHVTNSGVTTWYGFAQEIFRQAQKIEVRLPLGSRTSKHIELPTKMPLVTPVPSSRFPRAAKRPAYSSLLNTKLPPLRSWQEALREYLFSLKK